MEVVGGSSRMDRRYGNIRRNVRNSKRMSNSMGRMVYRRRWKRNEVSRLISSIYRRDGNSIWKRRLGRIIYGLGDNRSSKSIISRILWR